MDYLCIASGQEEAELLARLVAERVGFDGRSGHVERIGKTLHVQGGVKTVPCADGFEEKELLGDVDFPRRTSPVHVGIARETGPMPDVFVLAFVDTNGEAFPLATSKAENSARVDRAMKLLRSWKFSAGTWKGEPTPFVFALGVHSTSEVMTGPPVGILSPRP